MGSQRKHRSLQVGEVRLHVVEQGEGPLVLMVHGFPESWYSWRRQLDALSAAGYRAVAMDVRGYGRSSKPHDIGEYRMLRKVADVVGLVHALDEQSAVLVGHDWGAPIVWNSALLRPDLFRGVAGLSVPYTPPGLHRPLQVFRQMAGDHVFYIEHFQEPGVAESEIEEDVRSWLLGFYIGASGDAPEGQQNFSLIPRGRTMRSLFEQPDVLPDWLSEEDLEFYTAEFERSGMRGPLNRYRNVDVDWADLAAFRHRPVEIPALFIGGEKDGPTIWGASAIANFERTLPRLTKSVILEGCGHWVQQERPEETNRLLVEFLERLD